MSDGGRGVGWPNAETERPACAYTVLKPKFCRKNGCASAADNAARKQTADKVRNSLELHDINPRSETAQSNVNSKLHDSFCLLSAPEE